MYTNFLKNKYVAAALGPLAHPSRNLEPVILDSLSDRRGERFYSGQLYNR